MRVLVSYQALREPAGTEVYSLTLAEQFERLGHDAPLVTWQEGAMSEDARARGLQVMAPEAVPDGDVHAIVASDSATLLALAAHHPRAVRIIVMHSTEYMLQTPPQLPHACQAVVALNDRVYRRAKALAVPTRVVRLRQPVDLARFRALPPARRPPHRVAIFGNRFGGGRPGAFPDACRVAGMEPIVVGLPSGAMTTGPEHELREVDAVIGTGRCAIEGAAARRPVFVAGPAGLDGWLRPDLFADMEADGFSGRAGCRPDGANGIADELPGPPPPEVIQALYERVQRDHDARSHAEEVIALLEELGPPAHQPPGPLEEIARLIRIEFAAQLRLDRAESQLGLVMARQADLERQLEAEGAKASPGHARA